MNETIQTNKVTSMDLAQFCEDQMVRYTKWLGRIGCEGNLQNTPTNINYTLGKRFARIVIVEHGRNSSVICFIDLTNGDLHKGSWKAPVKNGIRGNIFAEDRGDSCMDGTGPKYLR